jgi:hypothetical protein
MPVILATLEIGIGRISVQGQTQAKSARDMISTNKKLGVVVYSYHPSYAGSVNGGSLFRPH